MIEKLQELFAEWLIDTQCDHLHTKDQLIDAQENGVYVEEFLGWVRNNV